MDHTIELLRVRMKGFAKQLFILLSMLLSTVGVWMYNSWFLTFFVFPSFNAFYWIALSTIICLVSYPFCCLFSIRPFNMIFSGFRSKLNNVKELPGFLHFTSLIKALELMLFNLTLANVDMATAGALMTLTLVFNISWAALIPIRYTSVPRLSDWRVNSFVFAICISCVMVVAVHPHLTKIDIVILLAWTACMSLVDTLTIKMRYDSKLSMASILTYTNVESMLWLFAFTFIIDLRALADYKQLTDGIGLLTVGALLYLWYTLSANYHFYPTITSDRLPYGRAYQCIMIVIFGLAYKPHLNPVNIAGIVCCLVVFALWSTWYHSNTKVTYMGIEDEDNHVTLPTTAPQQDIEPQNNKQVRFSILGEEEQKPNGNKDEITLDPTIIQDE